MGPSEGLVYRRLSGCVMRRRRTTGESPDKTRTGVLSIRGALGIGARVGTTDSLVAGEDSGGCGYLTPTSDAGCARSTR